MEIAAFDMGTPLEISISGHKSHFLMVAIEQVVARFKGGVGEWQRCSGRTQDDLRQKIIITFPSVNADGIPDIIAALWKETSEVGGWAIGSESLLEGNVAGTFVVQCVSFWSWLWDPSIREIIDQAIITRLGGALVLFNVAEIEVFLRIEAYTRKVQASAQSGRNDGDIILSLRRPGEKKPSWSLEQSTNKAAGRVIRGMPEPNPELDVWLSIANFLAAQANDLFKHLLPLFSGCLKSKGAPLEEELSPYMPVSKGRRVHAKDRCMLRLPSPAAVRLLIDEWHQQFVPIKDSGMKFRISLESRLYQRAAPALENIWYADAPKSESTDANAGMEQAAATGSMAGAVPYPAPPPVTAKRELEESNQDVDMPDWGSAPVNDVSVDMAVDGTVTNVSSAVKAEVSPAP